MSEGEIKPLTPQPAQPKGFGRILHAISTHPAVALFVLFSALVCLIAAPFTIWPWLAESKADLSYAISPTRARIDVLDKRSGGRSRV